MKLTPEMLSGAAGVLLSLGFSYIPGLRTWYAGRSEDEKKLVMLVALILVSVGVVLLSCTNFLVFVACEGDSLKEFLLVFLAALIANQSVYPITPKTSDVKALKKARG